MSSTVGIIDHSQRHIYVCFYIYLMTKVSSYVYYLFVYFPLFQYLFLSNQTQIKIWVDFTGFILISRKETNKTEKKREMKEREKKEREDVFFKQLHKNVQRPLAKLRFRPDPYFQTQYCMMILPRISFFTTVNQKYQ